MKKQTYYHIILDQSGSMQDCIDSTISGFNEQVQVIRSLQERYPEQEIRIGLTCFNDKVKHLSFGNRVSEQSLLTRRTYIPSGQTALYDAIGETVLRIRDRLPSLESADSSVIVVILTDGHENASTVFPLSGIRNMIHELEATEKWTFTYLGATLDACEIARELNIKQENSMAFEKSDMKETYAKVSRSLGNFFEAKKHNRKSSGFLFDGKE